MNQVLSRLCLQRSFNF